MTDDVDDRPPTRALTEDECWQRIAEASFGRVAAAAAGEVDIFPVNHAVDSHGADARTIVFRTSPGTKLIELTIHEGVAFEVDGFTDAEAFSVVVKGTAEQFDRRGEVEAAEKLGVTPWAPEEKTRWVRITPREVSGRTFQRRRVAPVG
ncbi:pyridoxamine 5'-phosphate oxidase family protein [Agromyces bauzanensis]|uniref:DNA-binding protein n=1 Tax=Agromyces bauzanensis TaxID=1308924 RepID=A0A917URT6_9MICO|nr:pyridoxamine 5'-phosphate oxidase family protein [Agromyces bauzanensis]GGJ80364.1 DNA-binding protein [Agromyces bauzanensis]